MLGFYYYYLFDTFTSLSISSLITLCIPFPLPFPLPSPFFTFIILLYSLGCSWPVLVQCSFQSVIYLPTLETEDIYYCDTFQCNIYIPPTLLGSTIRPVCKCEAETESLVTETKPELRCLYAFAHLNVSSCALVLCAMKHSSPWA